MSNRYRFFYIILALTHLTGITAANANSTTTAIATTAKFNNAIAPGPVPSVNLTTIFDRRLINRIRNALSRKPQDQTSVSISEEESEYESDATETDGTGIPIARNCTRKKVPGPGINSDEDSPPPSNCKKKVKATNANGTSTTKRPAVLTKTTTAGSVIIVTPTEASKVNCIKRNRTATATMANGTVVVVIDEETEKKCRAKNRTEPPIPIEPTESTGTGRPNMCNKKRPNETSSLDTSTKCWNKTLTNIMATFESQQNKIGDTCDPVAWNLYLKPIYDAIFRGNATIQAIKSEALAKAILKDRTILGKVCLSGVLSDILECRSSGKCGCFNSYPPGMESLSKCGLNKMSTPTIATASTSATKAPTPTLGPPPPKGHITCVTPLPKNTGSSLFTQNGVWYLFGRLNGFHISMYSLASYRAFSIF